MRLGERREPCDVAETLWSAVHAPSSVSAVGSACGRVECGPWQALGDVDARCARDGGLRVRACVYVCVCVMAGMLARSARRATALKLHPTAGGPTTATQRTWRPGGVERFRGDVRGCAFFRVLARRTPWVCGGVAARLLPLNTRWSDKPRP